MANEITTTRSSVASWSVSINGEYKGNVHKFARGGYILYCHDLLVKRGATFASLDKAVADLAARAMGMAA